METEPKPGNGGKMDLLKKIFFAILKIERAIGAVLLFVILAVVFVATVGRYSTLFKITFSEELARFCMIWLVFIGAAVCGYEGNLFNVDLIMPKLKRTGKIIFLIIRLILTLIFCIFAAKYGLDMIGKQLVLNQKSAMMGIPYAFMYSSVPVGCLLIALHYTIKTLIDIKELPTAGQLSENKGR